jgi:exportin-7
VIGIGDSQALLTLMMRKIVLNFRYWATESDVIDASAQLFYELVTGYSTIRLIVKLEASAALLAHHTSETFPFLDYAANQRCRVKFYSTLSRLLYMKSDGSSSESNGDLDATPDRLFATFVSPFTTRFEVLLQQPELALRSDAARDMVVGLALDLRGVILGVHTRKAFERALRVALSVLLARVPDGGGRLGRLARRARPPAQVLARARRSIARVACSLTLRAPTAFCCSRRRPSLSSPLARVCARCRQWASSTCGQNRYKPIARLLGVLTVRADGRLLQLWCVQALRRPGADQRARHRLRARAVAAASTTSSSTPKLAAVYFQFVDRVLAHHIEYACMLPSAQFAILLATLEQGLTYSEVTVSTQCCNALDALATYADKYRHVQPDRAPEPWHGARRARAGAARAVCGHVPHAVALCAV